MTIDIEFDEQQVRLGEAARELFARRATPSSTRELEAGETGFSPELWREIAALGWLGIEVPEEHGGGGGGFLDLYLLFEELGRALVLGPYHDTIGLAVPLLLALGTDEQRAQHLSAIASGDEVASLALVERSGGFGAADIELNATPAGDGGHVLSGTKLLVGWAPDADVLIVPARGPNGITLFLVDGHAPGVGQTRLVNLPADALYEVTFDDVHVGSTATLGSAGGGWEPLQDAMLRAAVLQAATIVGAARSVLEMTSDYARDRVQFGIPIGKNQAVQYMVSDILIDLHRADLLNRRAAYLIDHGRPHRREAAVSVAFAKAASAHLHRQAHEVHAGVAFIDEHVLTLYSKHAKLWENHLGDAQLYRELVVDSLTNAPG